MPGKQKSEWSKTLVELKAHIPKGLDARKFRGCRGSDGAFEKTEVAKVCDKMGFKDKADAVFTYLDHLSKKPAGKKRGPKKTKDTDQGKVNLLAKRTYSELSATDIGKVIDMLTEIQKDRKESEIAGLKAKKEEIEKKLKELAGK